MLRLALAVCVFVDAYVFGFQVFPSRPDSCLYLRSYYCSQFSPQEQTLSLNGWGAISHVLRFFLTRQTFKKSRKVFPRRHSTPVAVLVGCARAGDGHSPNYACSKPLTLPLISFCPSLPTPQHRFYPLTPDPVARRAVAAGRRWCRKPK